LWKGLDTLSVKSISLRKKALPGHITIQAKFNKPIKDCSERSVIFFFLWAFSNVKDHWQNSESLNLYTDASGNVGFAAVFGSWWLAGEWLSKMQSA
jgi:hypothetical protein